MIRIFCTGILILSSLISNAQSSASGRITEKESGEGIAGATIYFPELKTGTASDSTGFYKIDNLPKIKLTVQIAFLGYKTIVERVDFSIRTTINFILEQSVAEMNEVVVTGSSRASEIKRDPIPMATLDRRELEENLKTNIIDAITNLPGVSAVTTGPNVSKPFIHGLGYNRVLTLYDGVRQEGQQWGDEHGVEVDENSVDRIEIVKGPASLTYGSDALAGVVNMLPAHPATEGSIKGQTAACYQTNNGLYEATATLAGNTGGFIWGGVATYKQAKNYQNKNDGRVYGTAFQEKDLSGYVGINKKWGYSHLNFSIFDDLQEIPDGSRDSITRKFTKQVSEIDTIRPIVSDSELNSYNIGILHQHIQHFRFYSSSNIILGKSNLGLILGYQENIRREFSHPKYPEVAGLYLVLNTFTYDVKFHLPEYREWETTFGINGMYQKNRNNGTEFIIPNYNLFDIGPFTYIERAFDKVELRGGIRYDTRIFSNDAMFSNIDPLTGFNRQVSSSKVTDQPFHQYNKTFSGFSGSIGATYKLSDFLTLKSNIARGFRAPNISELSANGVHPGTLIYQIGNEGFAPEFSLQEDLGISFASKHVLGNFGIFNNNISNYIFNQKLVNKFGQDSIVVHGNQTFKFQQTKAQLYGFEANIDIHPHPLDWLHFENSISAVYAVNKGGNGIIVIEGAKYLPSIPPLHTSSELRVNFKRKYRNFSSVYAKIGMEYYAGQERIFSANHTETHTSGYILYNSGLGADITNNRGRTVANINILGSNITNVAYQSHLSRLKYFEDYPNNPTGRNGIYNMGRNIGFKLTVPLDFK
ncbi:MAG: TonB-dependent receptor [Bacteroidia bacterium]|nr:TonB-dependent receptor [Bacteroidia bacterium]